MDKRIMENLRVKRSIAIAYFRLLKTKNTDEISVSEITNTAGVSRMAYYRNFDSKLSVVEFFMDDILEEMVSTLPKDFSFWQPEYGTAFFAIMKKYREQILMLDRIGYSGVLLNKFTDANAVFIGDMPRSSILRYQLYYAAGASYNGVLEWLRSGCRETPEQMEESLRQFIRIEAPKQ